MKIILNEVEKPIVAESIEPVLVYDTSYYEDEAKEIWDAFLLGRPVYAVVYPNDDTNAVYVPLSAASCSSASSSDSSSGSGSSGDTPNTVTMYFYASMVDVERDVTLHIIPENSYEEAQ